MPFIIHANGETRKRDSMENNILYLSGPLIKHTVRHTGGGVKAYSHISMVLHCVVFVLLHCLTASRTGRKYSCVSTLPHIISFSIPSEMTGIWRPLYDQATKHISIHVVQYLIASCSAFTGSIIPTDSCLGCKTGLL